ncbi:MAG TPA: transcriptional regulator [Gemmatimonadaceae bacterium]|nr:transcriptional regulator [Gemmatimonadaceae bacterium]
MAKHGAVPNERGAPGARAGDGPSTGDGRDGSPLRGVRGKARPEGPLALDRLIHERMRLGILSALAATDSLSFNDLKKLLRTTDGNLSVHARKLEEANYIACSKSFEGRVPKTEYAITAPGRRAFERYLDHMEALIRAARER